MGTATVTRVPQLAASHLGLARGYGLRVPIFIEGYGFICLHSLRQARADYTGPLVKVRNGTSNAEATVAPSDGLLRMESIVTVTAVGTSGYSIGQTMALSTFIGSDSLYVNRWYDQWGLGYDLAQATPANQPRLANAGALETLRGLPAMYFADATDVLVSVTNFTRTQPQSGVYVGQTGELQGTPTRGVTVSALMVTVFAAASNLMRVSSGVNMDVAFNASGLPGAYGAIWNSTSSKLFLDGQQLGATGNAGSTNSNGVQVAPGIGYMFEHGLLDGVQDVAAITRLLGAHLGTVP